MTSNDIQLLAAAGFRTRRGPPYIPVLQGLEWLRKEETVARAFPDAPRRFGGSVPIFSPTPH
jgi:hypothetical protein